MVSSGSRWMSARGWNTFDFRGGHILILNTNGYVIAVSENALIQTVLNGLEAYSILNTNHRAHNYGLETYGLLWGHELLMSDNRTMMSIEMVSIDTTAKTTKDYCIPNEESLKLKRDLLTSFWPKYDFLGDFHTHPYEVKPEIILSQKLYNFSSKENNDNKPGDVEHIENDSSFWIAHNYRVGLVLTICFMDKCGTKKDWWLDDSKSTIQFTLGNYRMWLKGYIAHNLNNTLKVIDDNVCITCPAILGLTEHTQFGRYKNDNSKLHKTGHI